MDQGEPGYRELDGDQVRQLINTEQVFEAYRTARAELHDRFAGSMAWKTVNGGSYLYQARAGAWKRLVREARRPRRCTYASRRDDLAPACAVPIWPNG